MAANATHYSITGIPKPDTITPFTRNIPNVPNIPLRLEISKLSQSEDTQIRKQWTLFVLALARLKALPVDNQLSYFRIAGIHGYPMKAWNGAEDPAQDPDLKDHLPPGKDEFGGYCNHNSITFPTWHRVYLLLYEQCIWNHMKELIGSWSLEEADLLEWQNAADTWRLPYWDWGRDSRFPEAVSLDRVSIYPPKCQIPSYENPYPNPLTGFCNPEKDAHGRPLPFGSMPVGKIMWNITDNENNKPSLPWSRCSGTSRYGVDKTNNLHGYIGLEGRNRTDSASSSLTDCSRHWTSLCNKSNTVLGCRPPSSLSDAIRRMFARSTDSTWGTFASTKWWRESETGGPGCMSLEHIHNNVHNLCGGNKFSTDGGHGIGHMSDVPVAAFDPLFFLHHCNIDRLTAMWQCLNWDLWWDKPEPQHPNLAGGNFPDPLSTDPLLPFRTTKPDTFWTSDDVRDWTKLRYQYEDLVPQSGAVLPNGQLDEAKYQQDLRDLIHATYADTGDFLHAVGKHADLQYLEHLLPNQLDDRTWNDYILDVVYDRYALVGSSYTIEFYLRNQTRDSPIGEIYSFGGLPIAAGTTKATCNNCKSQQDGKVLSRTQVPITIPVVSSFFNDPQFNSLDPKVVARYLRSHLGWKFVRLGGQEVPSKQFPKTDISLWIYPRFGTENMDFHRRLYRMDNLANACEDIFRPSSLGDFQGSRWGVSEITARL